MERLTSVEKQCQDVLVLISDMMAPGRRMNAVTHTEIAGRVRDALTKLQNKEYGCASGKHAVACTCKEGFEGVTSHPRG